MNTSIVVRVVAGFALVVLATTLPWWVTIAIATIFTFYFSSYYEIIFMGVAMDSLFSTSFTLTLITICIFLVSFPLKKRISFYNAE